MKERPILFSGPMVRAILEGRKTQTRRVVKSQPSEDWHPQVGVYAPTMVDRHGEEYPGPDVFGASDECEGRICPHGAPGDHLWVRETFQPLLADGVKYRDSDWKTGIGYAPKYIATEPRVEYLDCFNDDELTDRCKPSIFMPRWASRITLEITDVRVQRVQEITEEDAEAEGVYSWSDMGPLDICAKPLFSDLWDSINAKRGFGWDVNPWVWALTFKRVAP
jgi:hypothetical protein